jgi:RNA polymerase sigma factor (sigma-70 family)
MNAEVDAELVARSRRQDAEAFGQLVERHQRLVFSVALARCNDPALAEDVAQEAFVTAWRDLDRLRDRERVGPWVAGIARNLAANAARVRARRAGLLELEAPSPVPTPQDEVLAREDRELLHRALAEVPETYRETLILYYMEGQSISTIAEALGVKEDVVKQRLSRSRRALRDGIQARVENALSRARTSPTFRAGVIAAIVANATRDATAAATAGKGVTMISKKVAITAATAKTVGIAAVSLAVAGSVVWLAVRVGHKPAPAVAQIAAATGGEDVVVRAEPRVVAQETKPSEPTEPVPVPVPAPRRVAPPTPPALAPRTAPPPAQPQPAVAGTDSELRGVVRSISAGDARLANATIKITPGDITVTTGPDGTFFVPLAAGEYTVSVSKPGFATVQIPATLEPNGVSIKNIDLR